MPFITGSGIIHILLKIDNELWKIIIALVILGIIFVLSLFNIRSGKAFRRKEFNEILRILLFYKENNKNV